MLEQVKLAKKNTIQGKINTNWRVYKKRLKVTPPTVGFVSLYVANIIYQDWTGLDIFQGRQKSPLTLSHTVLVVFNKF